MKAPARQTPTTRGTEEGRYNLKWEISLKTIIGWLEFVKHEEKTHEIHIFGEQTHYRRILCTQNVIFSEYNPTWRVFLIPPYLFKI